MYSSASANKQTVTPATAVWKTPTKQALNHNGQQPEKKKKRLGIVSTERCIKQGLHFKQLQPPEKYYPNRNREIGQAKAERSAANRRTYGCK